MGMGFYVQIVNATPWDLSLQPNASSYQMDWNPPSTVKSNSYERFYAEFSEAILHNSLDDSATADYQIAGGSSGNFGFQIKATKGGMSGLPVPLPNLAGFGIQLTWNDLPSGVNTCPPADVNSYSGVGWIHDGVVSVAIGYSQTAQAPVSAYSEPAYDASVSGGATGLAPSVLNWSAGWMGLYASAIGNLRLTELTLPGAHDSGTYNARQLAPWVRTQCFPFSGLLAQGIRAFDVRLMYDSSMSQPIQFDHGGIETNYDYVSALSDIAGFLKQNPNEIVILDFHSFDEQWTLDQIEDVVTTTRAQLTNLLLSNTFSNSTLAEILASAGRVVVALGTYSNPLPDGAMAWLEAQNDVWTDSVEQCWCGKSVTTWNHVSTYLQTKLDALTSPMNHLWALMAQYNAALSNSGVLGMPAMVPIEISDFFTAENGLRANIVDSDWCGGSHGVPGNDEEVTANFSVLINAVPLNLLKSYRKSVGLPLFSGATESVNIESASFPNAFLRMDGTNCTEFNSNGSGTVNCQYRPPGIWEQFSLNDLGGGIFNIESIAFPGVFLRMDGTNCTEFNSSGSGTVNCQFTPPGVWEQFKLVSVQDDIVNIESVFFPGVFLRMDGTNCTVFNGSGSGTVNCQFTPPGPWEQFRIWR